MPSNCTRMHDFLTAITEAEAAAATAKSKCEAAQDEAHDAVMSRYNEAHNAALAATEANAALGRYVYGLTRGKGRT